MYESWDAGLEVWSVFRDISKAFDKVWHEGVLFKIFPNGLSRKLLKLLTEFYEK